MKIAWNFSSVRQPEGHSVLKSRYNCLISFRENLKRKLLTFYVVFLVVGAIMQINCISQIQASKTTTCCHNVHQLENKMSMQLLLDNFFVGRWFEMIAWTYCILGNRGRFHVTPFFPFIQMKTEMRNFL